MFQLDIVASRCVFLVRMILLLVAGLARPQAVLAGPVLTNPALGTIRLVATDASALDEIDGLAFDAYGNLFGTLEIDKDAGGNPRGGLVYVDKLTGTITNLISDIDRADQIAFDPTSSTATTGRFYVTSESRGAASTVDRLFRVEVSYNAGLPQSVTKASVATTTGLLGLEGLVVLEHDAGAYGSAGDIFVAEDSPLAAVHGIAHITPAGVTTVLTPNGNPAFNLNRPEGLAFGDFHGALAQALYAAETSRDRIVRIDPTGAVSIFGMPTAIGLESPDNVEFGPDGFLYVSEDRGSGLGRIIRIASDGTHSVFATGFNSPQGLAFDPASGDLYISEQGNQTIWRVSFATTVPEPSTLALFGTGVLGLIGYCIRRQSTYHFICSAIRNAISIACS